MARKQYFKDYTDTQIETFMNLKDIKIEERPLYLFSEREKKQAVKYWKEHEREYLDKIIIREVYTDPIEIEEYNDE